MNDMNSVISGRNGTIDQSAVAEIVTKTCPADEYRGKRVLLIVPDGTRTAPVGLLFQTLHRHIGGVVKSLDVLIALGTHQPISEEAICQRLEMSLAEWRSRYANVRFFNHAWDKPE